MNSEKIKRELNVEKVTVNIGVGDSGEGLDKSVKLLQIITGRKPIYTKAKKRNQVFGIKKGQNIGTKVTIRGKTAMEFIKKAFDAVGDTIKKSSFDKYGNFSFGLKEYIDFPGIKYDPTIGLIGFDVCVSLSRPGLRVTKRRRKRSRIPRKNKITIDEAVDFIKNNFGIQISE